MNEQAKCSIFWSLVILFIGVIALTYIREKSGPKSVIMAKPDIIAYSYGSGGPKR